MTPLESSAPVTKRKETMNPGKISSPLRLENNLISGPFHETSPKHTVGRYDIIYPIASGGMASVYTGRLSGMAGFERLFAIKVIHPHLAAKRSFIEMFLDEARLAGRIHHPNVAEIFEVGEDNGIYYMVGELVLGQDLRRLTAAASKAGIQIPSTVVASIIASTAKGLHEAHELRDEDGEPSHLVHRDVSTQNILISYRGYTKLIDFGVAWARGRLSYTRDGSQKGKIGYMPPEQLRGEAIDRRCDIYALGVVLYTALLGTHPFPYENEGEQVAKMMAGDFPRPSAIDPNIAPSLEGVILKAMANNSDDRFCTAQEMGAALSEYVKRFHRGADPLKQLAEQMQSLFSEEIIAHEEKIRRHRKQSPAANRSKPIPLPPSTAPVTSASRVTEVVGVVSEDNADAPSRRSTAATARRRTQIGTLFMLVVILSIAAVAYRSVFPQRTAPSTPATSHAQAASTETPRESGQKRTMPVAPPKNTALSNEITIQIEGLTPQSDVFVDGQRSTLPIKVARGTTPIQLRIETPRFDSFKTTLIPDKDRTVLISLKKTAEPSRHAKRASREKTSHKKRESEAQAEAPSEKHVDLSEWEKNPFL